MYPYRTNRLHGLLGSLGGEFSPKRGRSISKTKAMKQYQFSPSDFDNIKPTGSELAEKIEDIRKTLQQNQGNGDNVPQTESTVTTKEVKERYKLDSVQLRRIRLCKRRLYKVRDVEVRCTIDAHATAAKRVRTKALVRAMSNLRNVQAPTVAGTSTSLSSVLRAPRRRVPRKVYDDYEWNGNFFDNMSREEADEFMADLLHGR
ncbi:hypothetical protein BC835DRAFT_1414736 [Cytidiella melzeri]|nr:hypothetical protein BC835DRAFT_1414736 [Cytidiella melzeri]